MHLEQSAELLSATKSSCGYAEARNRSFHALGGRLRGLQMLEHVPRPHPKSSGRRHIRRMARRRGISHEDAYILWVNRRLSWSHYRYLLRKA